MKLELQVCSLEHAKKLEELGFKQDSLFYWYKESGGDYEAEIRRESDVYDWGGEKDYRDAHKNKEVKKMCSAYTVAELGEMLPVKVVSEGATYFWVGYRNSASEYLYIFHKAGEHIARLDDTLIKFYARTEVDARAKMLVWLVENKHINPKEGE